MLVLKFSARRPRISATRAAIPTPGRPDYPVGGRSILGVTCVRKAAKSAASSELRSIERKIRDWDLGNITKIHL
jgi:hypothetical protein